MSFTKALFALEKFWTLGTLLLQSMPKIILSRCQTSMVFILNNSCLINTFLLCLCSSHYFYLAFSCIYYIVLHSIFTLEGCRSTAESSCSFYRTFWPENVYIVVRISVHHWKAWCTKRNVSRIVQSLINIGYNLDPSTVDNIQVITNRWQLTSSEV